MFQRAFKSLWFRLFLGFAVPTLLFVAAALVGFVAVQRLIDALDREKAARQVMSEIYLLKKSLEAMGSAKRGHHLLGNDDFKVSFDHRRQEFLQHLDRLEQLVGSEPEGPTLLKKIRQLERDNFKNALPSFQLWQRRPKSSDSSSVDWFDKLTKWYEKLNLEHGVKLTKEISKEIDSLETRELNQLNRHRSGVLTRTQESSWAILAALLISIVFSIVITLFLSASITKPIDQLGRGIHALRKGKFEAIRSHGPTEIAALIRGFNLMGIALSERTTMLEHSELRYRTVVGTTASLLWTTNALGEIADMTNWRGFTGQSEEEAAADGWLQAVHPDDRERFVQHWTETLKTRAHSKNEFRIRRADGVYRDFVCRSAPIVDTQEEVVEWVRTGIDITERKQEEKMRRQKEAAEAANRAKSAFLAKMSHELRTPLNAIIGMSKMLATMRFGKLNDKQLDYLADIAHAGEHLLRLINDILDYAMLEVERVALHPESFCVGATVQRVMSGMQNLAETKSIRFITKLPEPQDSIIADPNRFSQVLYNLVSNAIKFTPDGGQVEVRCLWVADTTRDAPESPMKEAGALRIDVQDSGIGIAADDQKKLGTEFFQAGSAPNKAQEGAGLGLALSRRLAERMGGSLWFTSKPGHGSTFSLALPLRRESD